MGNFHITHNVRLSKTLNYSNNFMSGMDVKLESFLTLNGKIGYSQKCIRNKVIEILYEKLYIFTQAFIHSHCIPLDYSIVKMGHVTLIKN